MKNRTRTGTETIQSSPLHHTIIWLATSLAEGLTSWNSQNLYIKCERTPVSLLVSIHNGARMICFQRENNRIGSTDHTGKRLEKRLCKVIGSTRKITRWLAWWTGVHGVENRRQVDFKLWTQNNQKVLCDYLMESFIPKENFLGLCLLP